MPAPAGRQRAGAVSLSLVRMTPDRPWSVYRRLLGYAAAEPWRLALIAAGLAVVSGATLSVPWLARELFRGAAGAPAGPDEAAVGAVLVLITAAAAAMAVGRFVAEDQLGVVSLGMLGRLRGDLLARLLRLPPGSLGDARPGETASRLLADVQILQMFLYDAVFALGSDLLITAGATAFLIALSPALSLWALAAAPLGVAVVALAAGQVRRRFAAAQAAAAEMAGVLTEQVDGLSAIRTFGAAGFEARRFAAASDEHLRRSAEANRVHAAARSAVNFLGAAGIVLVLGFGRRWLEGDASLSLDRLIGFALYAAVMADPLARLSRTCLDIQRSLAAGRRVFELLDRPVEPTTAPIRLTDRPAGRIVFASVRFAYRPGEPVLEGVDLAIEPGRPTAIVGATGAGKSTLVALLLRAAAPTAGRVTLDGRDLAEIDPESLRRWIGWVGQEPHLVTATVAENIAYGREATPAQIEAAARTACADEFVRTLPAGYATRIGPRGLGLSGGQRARLAIARAVLADPALAVFDEAAAALDADTESRLWANLTDWMAARTVVIIAHRLSTIAGAPRVVVLDAGRIVGDGPPDALAESCPAFVRLFGDQAAARTGLRPGSA